MKSTLHLIFLNSALRKLHKNVIHAEQFMLKAIKISVNLKI